MATIGFIEYLVVTGTVTAITTFNNNVEAKVNLGYAAAGTAYIDAVGTNISQLMYRGNAGSFIQNIVTTIAPTVGAAGAGAFTIVGDQTANFRAGFRFTIQGSTSNDAIYTVRNGGSTFAAGNTTIPVVEAVGSSVVDGQIICYGS
jgi:hypothetical protein